MGDSRGRWEGDTLVVDTIGFNEKTELQGYRHSEALHMVERFRRTDFETIQYEVTIDDPATWTKPWTGEIPMKKAQGPLYEFACHEGNYGMAGVLAGARAEERAAAKK